MGANAPAPAPREADAAARTGTGASAHGRVVRTRASASLNPGGASARGDRVRRSSHGRRQGLRLSSDEVF